MRHKLITSIGTGTVMWMGLFLVCAGSVTDAAGQSPATAKRPPANTTPGSGVGAGNGSGTGAGTGSGIGGATGSGIGLPAGSVVVIPNGNPAGQASGSGTGTIGGSGTGAANGSGTGTSTGTGTGTGSGTGTGTGSGTGIGTDASGGTNPAPLRTYIRELSGRCYYVTPQGAKRYVARRNCVVSP